MFSSRLDQELADSGSHISTTEFLRSEPRNREQASGAGEPAGPVWIRGGPAMKGDADSEAEPYEYTTDGFNGRKLRTLLNRSFNLFGASFFEKVCTVNRLEANNLDYSDLQRLKPEIEQFVLTSINFDEKKKKDILFEVNCIIGSERTKMMSTSSDKKIAEKDHIRSHLKSVSDASKGYYFYDSKGV